MLENKACNEATLDLTHSSVVYRYSVHFAFLIAGLNDVDIMACDVGNTYMNVPFCEKNWFASGPKNVP